MRGETCCSFRLTARCFLYVPSHKQDGTYHDLCYTSCGALAGTRNSSMGPPDEGSIRWHIASWANTLTTELHLAPSNNNNNNNNNNNTVICKGLIKIDKTVMVLAFIPYYKSLFHQRHNTPQLRATVSFIVVHRWSIGLRYGLFQGHSSSDVSFSFRNSVAGWEETPSWMKIMQPSTCMCSFGFSMSNSMYLAPTIVMLGGPKYRPAVPRHDMATQIIWLDGCFTVAITYYLSIRFPNGSLMCTWRGTNCCMVLSFPNNTFFQSARVQWRWRLVKSSLFFFISGVRCGFIVLPVGLQSNFFAETSRNSAGMYCCTF